MKMIIILITVKKRVKIMNNKGVITRGMAKIMKPINRDDTV